MIMEPLPNKRWMSKSEMLANDLASDLEKETESINTERKLKGKKPIETEINTSTNRHSEHR